MIALGIDPGTRRMGYGVVRAEKGSVTFIAAGILKIASVGRGSETDDVRTLRDAARETAALIKRYRPAVMAVERLFFAKNRGTAMAVAQARGAVLLAAAGEGIPIKEYAPNEMKLGITGYGFADKKAVLKMVRLILKKQELRVVDDASDALALAIMACGREF